MLITLGDHHVGHHLRNFLYWFGFQFLINGPLKIASNKTVIGIYKKAWVGWQHYVFLPCGKEPIWFYTYLSSWTLIITLSYNLTFTHACWAALASCSSFSLFFLSWFSPIWMEKIRVERIQPSCAERSSVMGWSWDQLGSHSSLLVALYGARRLGHVNILIKCLTHLGSQRKSLWASNPPSCRPESNQLVQDMLNKNLRLWSGSFIGTGTGISTIVEQDFWQQL